MLGHRPTEKAKGHWLYGHDLSEAQKQVARGIAKGMSLVEIAEARGVTPATVKAQLGQTYIRLGLTGEPDARVLLARMVERHPEHFAARPLAVA